MVFLTRLTYLTELPALAAPALAVDSDVAPETTGSLFGSSSEMSLAGLAGTSGSASACAGACTGETRPPASGMAAPAAASATAGVAILLTLPDSSVAVSYRSLVTHSPSTMNLNSVGPASGSEISKPASDSRSGVCEAQPS